VLPPDSAFEALWAVFVRRQRRIVTSNVLQEVWKARLPAKLRVPEHRFVEMAAKFQKDFTLEEEVVLFRDLWESPVIRPLVTKLGVTDAGLVMISQSHGARLLTEDRDLLDYARAIGLEALGAGSS
jgi:predicted nucleic acid-binding protein